MVDPVSPSKPQATGVRLVDVARYAEVSPPTVTRTLSGKGYVHPKTRRKVLDAVQALSYEPNLLARGLRSGTTTSVGLIWSMATLSPAADVIQRIAIALQSAGYSTHLSNNLAEAKVTKQALSEMAQRKVDGVVLNGAYVLGDSDIHRLLKSFRAVVIAGSNSFLLDTVPELEYDCVFQNQELAIRDIVDHLAARDRRKLAMLMPASGNEYKSQVFIDQSARHGCRVQTINVEIASDSLSSDDFKRALEDKVGENIDFDALFCVPDEGAAKAMSHLKRLGYRIPEDVAVVGFNDSDFAEDLSPPLASVARHDEQLTNLLVERILARLSGEDDGPPQQHEIRMEFVPRESAG